MRSATWLASRSDPGDHPAAGSIRVDVSGRGRSRSAHALAAGLDGDQAACIGRAWRSRSQAVRSPLAAAGRFVLRGTTLHPTGQPARLVVSGAHAWSRNPMYLSLTVIYVGLALALGRAWPLVLVVLPWASMNWAVIPFEEARLRETFGEDYRRLLPKGSALDLNSPSEEAHVVRRSIEAIVATVNIAGPARRRVLRDQGRRATKPGRRKTRRPLLRAHRDPAFGFRMPCKSEIGRSASRVPAASTDIPPDSPRLGSGENERPALE